jgi:ApaG protein
MVEQITQGIKVAVRSKYEGAYIRNYKMQFAFTYQVSISNHSKDVVQLTHRKWFIFDALNHPETVYGEGVIGEKPIIQPGQTHTYSSGCLLAGPIGAMQGSYEMVNFSNARSFQVTIPRFELSAPFAVN